MICCSTDRGESSNFGTRGPGQATVEKAVRKRHPCSKEVSYIVFPIKYFQNCQKGGGGRGGWIPIPALGSSPKSAPDRKICTVIFFECVRMTFCFCNSISFCYKCSFVTKQFLGSDKILLINLLCMNRRTNKLHCKCDQSRHCKREKKVRYFHEISSEPCQSQSSITSEMGEGRK